MWFTMPENRIKNGERAWYNDLYDRLKRKEGEKELYRLARHRDKAGKKFTTREGYEG